jgi:trigger factor
MNVNIENTSALGRKVAIQVEPAEIKRELDRAYNELRRGVVLRGFRPGRAPRNLLERFFGDQVRSDVIQRLVKEYTEKALEEHQLKPVVEPEIITEEANLPETLKFSAVFDLRPEIVVTDYENLRVPEERVEVSDKDVDETLERMRMAQARLKQVEDRTTVREGDIVRATVEAYENGKPISEVRVEGRLLEVSRDALAHRLDELLTGAEVGKEVRATFSYGADYERRDLAGRTVEWCATVKEIYQRELPALDDDFAKDQGDCQNLEELRARIRRDLTERARAEAESRARQGLLDLILERNPVETPESFVVREQRSIEADFAAAMRAGGADDEQVNERIKAGAEEFRARAEKRVRTALVLDAIADQEKIEVSDDELAERLGAIMRQGGARGRERLADFYSHDENREALRRSMRREKALDHLYTRARGGHEPDQPQAES